MNQSVGVGRLGCSVYFQQLGTWELDIDTAISPEIIDKKLVT